MLLKPLLFGGFVYLYLRNSVSRPFYPIRKTRIRAVLDRKISNKENVNEKSINR